MVSEILHSPAPLAALTIVAIICWKILGFVKTVLIKWSESTDLSHKTFFEQMKTDADKRVADIKSFTDESKALRKELSDAKIEMMDKMNVTNIAVKSLSDKLHSVYKIVDHRLSMIPNTNEAIKRHDDDIDKIKRAIVKVATGGDKK